MTIGVRGQRGDWDEAKGQRLLWQPLHLAFAPNGDIYIGEGHANESPNDVDKSPTNSVGAARILHLDKNGKFIDQWFGNHAGQGHFSMVHGIAMNPDNGNVYIGDREEYRLVVYDAHGKFIKTIQMRNLTCALYVDPHKQLWLATGQDGQIFKIDWDGNVLGAIGNGPGNGEGQFYRVHLHGDGRAGQSLRGRHQRRPDHQNGRVEERHARLTRRNGYPQGACSSSHRRSTCSRSSRCHWASDCRAARRSAESACRARPTRSPFQGVCEARGSARPPLSPFVMIGHPVTPGAMRDHVALEPPIAPAVHEIPPLALFLDGKTDCERPDADRRHHLEHRRLLQHAIRFPPSAKAELRSRTWRDPSGWFPGRPPPTRDRHATGRPCVSHRGRGLAPLVAWRDAGSGWS